MLRLAMGRMVNQRKFHDPGPLLCRFLEKLRIDTSDLNVTVLCRFPQAQQQSFLCLLLYEMSPTDPNALGDSLSLVDIGMPRRLSRRIVPACSTLSCASTHMRLDRRCPRGLGP